MTGNRRPTSLIKFADQQDSAGQRLFWGRASEDGLPFRGPADPLLTTEEYEKRVIRTSDFHWQLFDLEDPKQAARFTEVMDRCLNGWYKLIEIQRFVKGEMKHYVEWGEYFMEDGTATPFAATSRRNGHAR